MGILIEKTRNFEDIKKIKSIKEIVTSGNAVSIMDATIESISVPAICSNCNKLNTIVAEEIEIVEISEREMGRELHHYANGQIDCKNCSELMEISIDLFEYPEGSITFYDDNIEAIANCIYEKDADPGEHEVDGLPDTPANAN